VAEVPETQVCSAGCVGSEEEAEDARESASTKIFWIATGEATREERGGSVWHRPLCERGRRGEAPATAEKGIWSQVLDLSDLNRLLSLRVLYLCLDSSDG
jgi:hypothetical protein